MMLRGIVLALAFLLAACSGPALAEAGPWHHDIVATTFWIGEIFDPHAADGSQEISAYDPNWMVNYGGCDGIVVNGSCRTEPRDASNGFFPKHMAPKQNPFYLDLPVLDPALKNRWVELRKDGNVCFGQVEDAGPAVYDDHDYVFGTARPKNKRFNGSGLDVSPALNGCLGFSQLDGQHDRLDWRFVEQGDVPVGPWTRITTTNPAAG
jgi:hypothetical protein